MNYEDKGSDVNNGKGWTFYKASWNNIWYNLDEESRGLVKLIMTTSFYTYSRIIAVISENKEVKYIKY
jgi:hypothetical protein